MRAMLQLAAVALGLAAHAAHANVIASSSGDGCTRYVDSGAIDLQLESQASSTVQNARGDVTVGRSATFSFGFPNGGSGYLCAMSERYTYVNTPNPPILGPFEVDYTLRRIEAQQNVLRLLRERINIRRQNYEDKDRFQRRTPTAVTGTRASLQLENGFSLTEGSPAYSIFEYRGIDFSDLASDFAIPFMVDSPGDGDWLALYLGADMFFKQPLSAFSVGSLYWAPVPSDLLLGAPLGGAAGLQFTYWLHSIGQAGASVYFPDLVRFIPDDDVPTSVPEPNTLTLLACGLALLGWSSRRRRSRGLN